MTRCVTDLSLERYLVDELEVAGEHEHIASCVRCRAAVAAKRTAGDAYMASPAARTVARVIAAMEPVAITDAAIPNRRRRSPIVVAAGMAIAVLLVVLLWPRGSTDREAEVLAVERDWMNAYVQNDADALDAILADEYKLTDSAGHTTTKADDLADARTGNTHYDAYDTTDVRVHVWGDTAVITGRSKIRGSSAGRPFAHDITFTDTLARIDGRWRAVAAHVSRTRAP